MGSGLEDYIPPDAIALADAMQAEFGPRALDIARQRLRMRMRDELPRMINLYSAVCALLVERQDQPSPLRRWLGRLAG